MRTRLRRLRCGKTASLLSSATRLEQIAAVVIPSPG